MLTKNYFLLHLDMIICLCLVIGHASQCRAADNAEVETQRTLSIFLRGNPSTGHFWSWTASGEGAVQETGIGYEQKNDMPGSPATYEYVFVGEKEGDVVLHFVYSQSDTEQLTDRINTYRLKVYPDKRVSLLDMEEDI